MTTLGLLASTAGAAHAQECFSLQQEYPSLQTSAVSETGRLLTVTDPGGTGTLIITFHSHDAGTGMYGSDPTVGTLPATSGPPQGDWQSDMVDDFAIVGAPGDPLTPGVAYVTESTPTGFTAPSDLRTLALFGLPGGVSDSFGHDVALAAIDGAVLAFVGDPELNGDGAIVVFDVTNSSSPVLVDTISMPTGWGTASRFGHCIDIVETSAATPGASGPVHMIVGAPHHDFGHAVDQGAALVYDLDYNASTMSLILPAPAQLNCLDVPDISTTSTFASSVGIGETYAIISNDSSDMVSTPIAYAYHLTSGSWSMEEAFMGLYDPTGPVHISRTGTKAIVTILRDDTAGLWTRTGMGWFPSRTNIDSGPTGFAGSGVTDESLSVAKLKGTVNTDRAVGRLSCSSAVFRELSSSDTLCTMTGTDQGVPNSAGVVATLTIDGTFDIAGSLALSTSGLPSNSLAFQLSSTSSNSYNPTGDWRLCIGMDYQRHMETLEDSGSNGTIDGTIDTSSYYFSGALTGQRLYFQTYHRDVDSSGNPSFNLSDAVGICLWN